MARKVRESAHSNLRAVDHLLTVVLGKGLSFFLASGGEGQEESELLAERRTLVLHLDEGSPTLAMCWWLLYHTRVRIVPVWDIFHREWNDCKNAIKAALPHPQRVQGHKTSRPP